MEQNGSALTIGEAASRIGVAASTLRYWEATGLFAAPQRVGGQRRYDAESLQQLSLVVLMKRGGFKLGEIRTVLARIADRTPPAEIWQELASRKLPEVEYTLVQAGAVKQSLKEGLGCGCESIDDCLGQLKALISAIEAQYARESGDDHADGARARRTASA